MTVKLTSYEPSMEKNILRLSVVYNMNFQQFWERLSTEIKTTQTFQTHKRDIKFDAIMIDTRTVQVTPHSSKEPRRVPISQFQDMWKIMKNDPYDKRYIGTNGRYDSFWSSSYVCALVDHIVSHHNME